MNDKMHESENKMAVLPPFVKVLAGSNASQPFYLTPYCRPCTAGYAVTQNRRNFSK